jgi:hypothetical protein
MFNSRNIRWAVHVAHGEKRNAYRWKNRGRSENVYAGGRIILNGT